MLIRIIKGDKVNELLKEILIILGGVLVCGGFWTFIQFMINRHDGRKQAMQDLQEAVAKLQASMDTNNKNTDLQSEALKAIAQDRIVWLCKQYIKQTWVPIDDYKSLKRMADSYRALGGNDLAKIYMDEVDKLPRKDK